MALNLPRVVSGVPTSSGPAGMDNLTRILELKSRQDTLALTREQLDQRRKELQFEEQGRGLRAAQVIFENTTPGSASWKAATGHLVRAYGGNPDAINVPTEEAAKAIAGAIKKINAAGDQYTKGKLTRQQYQDLAAEIGTATLMGLGAYDTPLTKESPLGLAAGMLTDAAAGGQKVINAGQQEDIATAGHAARTAQTTSAMRERAGIEVDAARQRYQAQADILGTRKGGTSKDPAEARGKAFDKYLELYLDRVPKEDVTTTPNPMSPKLPPIETKTPRRLTVEDVAEGKKFAAESVKALFGDDEESSKRRADVEQDAGEFIDAGIEPEYATFGALAEQVGPEQAFALPDADVRAGRLANREDVVNAAVERGAFVLQLAERNMPAALRVRGDFGGFIRRLLLQAGVPPGELPAVEAAIRERGAARNAPAK